MLPSGNDAAFALAQHFGKNLFRKKYTHADISRIKSYQFNYHPYYAKYFLKEMNEFAEKLHMTSTYFDSPHGLMNIQNYSTAHDMAKLSALCMKNEIFRNIVQTKVYECVGKSKFDISTECHADRKRKRQQREVGEKEFGEFYK
jgi:D-alanyl-D-alanine carboxypeptidase